MKVKSIARVHTRQGNVREIYFFSRSGNCQGILCCVSEKWIFAKMSGKCQGIFVFQFVSNDEKQNIARVVFLTFWMQAKLCL